MSDVFTDAVQLFLACGLGYSVAMIGRAVACRIAGPQAGAVLGMSILTLNFATPLPRLRSGNDQAESNETENSETGENSRNGAVSTVSDYMSVSDQGQQSIVKRMTPEEMAELRDTRNNALALLARSIDYYKTSKKIDTGIIPRYNHVGMGSDQRQRIARDLEYSGLVSIITSSKTTVVPEIGTCSALLLLIRDGKKRVYPEGYCERGKALLDSAVNALPEVEH